MGIGNRLLVVIDADVKGAIRELDKLGDKADKNLKGTDAKIDKFANGALKFGAAVSAGAAVAGVGLYKAAQQASDLNESITKSEVVFGRQGNAVTKWAGGLADSFGLSKREALAAAGAFGSMFRTTGLAGGEAAKMSKRMTELAGDMASFNNEDPSEMLDRLRSGLAGEAEPLRRFGVLLSEARVQSFAYANGIAAAGSKLTEAQKVQARYGLILKDTKLQQGDFARTADGAANSQRRLQANVDNLTTSIGQAALPVLKTATGALAAVAGGFADVSEASGGAVGNLALIGTAGAGSVGGVLLLAGALVKLKTSLSETATTLPKVAAAAKGLGALSALAVGILTVKDAYDELVASGEGNAQKFTKGIVPGSPDFVSQLDAANTRLQNLSATYDQMGSGLLGQKRSQAFGEIFQGIAGADVSRGIIARSSEIRNLSDDIIKLNESAQRGWRNVGLLRRSFEGGFVNEGQLPVATIQRLADVMGIDLFQGGRKGRAGMLELASALEQAGGPTEANAQKLIALAAAQGQSNNATDLGTAASGRHTRAIEEEQAALDKRHIALLASFNSEIASAQSTEALGEVLARQHTPLEERAALLAAAGDASTDMANKLKAAGVDVEAQATKDNILKEALNGLKGKYPELTPVIDEYIGRINSIPTAPTTTPQVNTGPAMNALDSLITRFGTLAALFAGGNLGKLFNGGKDGNPFTPMAKGGRFRAGQTLLVGEEGPEILTPDRGGRILNARDSAARLKSIGSSSGGNTYVINVNSLVPTAATGQLIREHLHKAERAGVTTSSVAG